MGQTAKAEFLSYLNDVRGNGNAGHTLNIGEYSIPFSDFQSGAMDMKPLPTSTGLGLNQLLYNIYGHFRQGCVAPEIKC